MRRAFKASAPIVATTFEAMNPASVLSAVAPCLRQRPYRLHEKGPGLVPLHGPKPTELIEDGYSFDTSGTRSTIYW
jgi:hypothetical protein